MIYRGLYRGNINDFIKKICNSYKNKYTYISSRITDHKKTFIVCWNAWLQYLPLLYDHCTAR